MAWDGPAQPWNPRLGVPPTTFYYSACHLQRANKPINHATDQSNESPINQPIKQSIHPSTTPGTVAGMWPKAKLDIYIYIHIIPILLYILPDILLYLHCTIYVTFRRQFLFYYIFPSLRFLDMF